MIQGSFFPIILFILAQFRSPTIATSSENISLEAKDDSNGKKILIEKEIEQLRDELEKKLETISDLSSRERITEEFRARIYEKYFLLLERVSLHPSSSPKDVVSTLREKGNSKETELREISALVICDLSSESDCKSVAAYGDEGSIPKEVIEPLGFRLFQGVRNSENGSLFLLMHNHPMPYIKKIYSKNNKFGGPGVLFAKPENMLTGPSIGDCWNYLTRFSSRYSKISWASIIVDQGGIWICKADFDGSVDFTKSKPLQLERDKLVLASQSQSGENLKKSIHQYEANFRKIYFKVKGKIAFFPNGVSELEIRNKVMEFN